MQRASMSCHQKSTNRAFRRSPPLRARMVNGSEIPELLAASQDAIGRALAPLERVRQVHDRDPRSIWALERGSSLVGVVSFLFLAKPGLEALLEGTLNPAAPPLELLCRCTDQPAGVYVWSIYSAAPGAGPALREIIARLQQARRATFDLWAAPVTEAGLSFFCKFGFTPWKGGRADIYRYRRELWSPPIEGNGDIQ